MKNMIGGAALLALASIAPLHSASAQNEPLIGGLVGGALGAGVGAAIGGSAGAAIAGGIIGGATGAMIGAAAQPRPGYYAYRRGCYVKVGYQQYRAVNPRYCY